jgi:hypothetical protein
MNRTAIDPEPSAVLRLVRKITGARPDLEPYPRSVAANEGAGIFLTRLEGKQVGLVAAPDVLERFDGASLASVEGDSRWSAKLGPLNHANARLVRELFPDLVPRPLGLVASAGCGDRLGLATPGHIRAFRRSRLRPVLAQQSMRENTRTRRSPEDVIDDAMWGAVQEGWHAGFGADGDHLKTVEDVERSAAAGCSLFTIDSSEHVDNGATSASADELERKLAAISWASLDTTWSDTAERYRGRIDLGTLTISPDADAWARAAAKYARVVAHTVTLSQAIARATRAPFEIEVSVDESETVTSLAEHIYIAGELRRLGVRPVSLAPRYVGEFMKGIDYIGDVDEFARTLAEHRAVAKTFGPYKLSLHSGSDKFSIFDTAAGLLGDLVHLKTSGTSYVEAVRAAATIEPDLVRQLITFALDTYPTARVGYHVSGDASRVPNVWRVGDAEVATLLDDTDVRQIVHVAFGAVIQEPSLRDPLLAILRSHEDVYYTAIERHFARHFAPFAGTA